MILYEIFDSTVKYQWEAAGMGFWGGRFYVDSVEYNIAIESMDSEKGIWDVEFARIDRSQDNVDVDHNNQVQNHITGTGNSHTVFSTIIQMIQEFVSEESPYQIQFSSAESTRTSLYKKISSTIGRKMGYNTSVSKNAESKDLFILTKTE